MHLRRHKRSIHILIACALALAGPLLRAEKNASCDGSDWFSIQQAQIQGKKLSSLCQAELDVAANRILVGTRELNSIIRQAPQSAEAYEARSTLTHLYLRIGRFHDAEAQIAAMLAIKPTAADLRNLSSLFELLAGYPDLTVSSRRPSVLRAQIDDGNIFAPVTVNGLAGTYMLDSGLNLSMMSESEAQRLHLAPQSSIATLSDISGREGAKLRVVNVDDLIVGGTHLRHVPFLVVDDRNGAFTGLPSGHRGILGIQPLLALEVLTFRADDTLEIGSHTAPVRNTAPLLFDRAMPLTQIEFQGKRLTVTLDCGATQTTLNPPFARLYPALARSGTQAAHAMNGLSGTTSFASFSLPHLDFTFGRHVVLAPAVILASMTTRTSSWASANLGFDLLKQARPFTLNFKRMEVEFPPPSRGQIEATN